MSSRTRSPLRTTLSATSLAVAGALTLAACGAGEQQSTEPAATGTEASAAAADGVQRAIDEMAALEAEPTWPEIPAIEGVPDLNGKTVVYLPLGDQIPVINGLGVGVTEALGELGATVKTCDGKFNPTEVANCLKTAGDEQVDGVIASFIDYQMAGPAFDALAASGVPVLLAGVAPSGGREADETLAFFDSTARVNALYDAMSMSALSLNGADTNVLWIKLMDSTTTTGASEQGVATFKEFCPSCGFAETEFTTANLDKLASSVSAALVANPETNTVIVPVDSFVPPVLQGIQASNFADKVQVVSSSSDLAGLQRVKDGQQASDLGTPVLFEGWRTAHAFVQLLAGEDVAANEDFVTRNFTANNVGDLPLTPEAYLSDEWWGGDGYKDIFRAAWGL